MEDSNQFLFWLYNLSLLLQSNHSILHSSSLVPSLSLQCFVACNIASDEKLEVDTGNEATYIAHPQVWLLLLYIG